MLPPVPPDQLFDRPHQRQSFTKWRSLAHLDDQARDSACGRFLTQFTKKSGQFFFAVFIYDSSGSQLRLRIHAHVEGTVSDEAETARRILELARRNTKIKERAVYGANAKLVKDTGCVPEIRLPHDDAAAKTRESLAHMLHRIRILIQSQNIGARFQKGFCVTTTAACSIYDQGTWFRIK
jgi:hypothetical protein